MLLFTLIVSSFAGTSALWGTSGELWDPTGRLPDFSYAGYRGGEIELPTPSVSASVLDFGAVADGLTDNTEAFQAAIDATSGGALEIPAGDWLIDGSLTITHGDIVLRGAGAGVTNLLFSSSLADLFGPIEQWSWSGGLISVYPQSGGGVITSVTAPALRGDTSLSLGDTSGIEAGDFITLRMTDDEDATMGWHLHNDQEPPGDCSYQLPLVHDWPVEIAEVGDESVILSQPLRHDIRVEWQPTIYSWNGLQEVGIESVSIVFPETEFLGHLNDLGYNGIFMTSGVANSWIRDVTIVNGDNGFLLDSLSKWITISEVNFEGRGGHHGLNIAHSADILVSDFHYEANYFHAMSVDHRSNGNVFERASSDGFVLELDHHRDTPFENLFTDFSAETNLINGGSWCAGTPGAARNTFWGLPTSLIPPYWDHVQTNIVGSVADDLESLTEDQEWLEPIDDLRPRNLYRAQLANRLGYELPDTGSTDTGSTDTGDTGETKGCGCKSATAANTIWAYLAGFITLLIRRRNSSGLSR
jgi:hypothetical protein